ncbi:MAG: uracil-DNA glycosylase [Pseudonocardiales bacterium]|nr:MAG: uracil-DNA glycosylase [Pseudonocardiales bacterium]
MNAPWEALAAAVRACVSCSELAASRTLVVVGEAPPGARLALVGEAPGAQEDAAGRPFVGRAGALLDTLLAEVGVQRADVAVLNVLKCRPPSNRVPRPAEVANCRPWLEQQLDLVAPRVTVALGLSATRWFLGRTTTLGAVRGRLHEVSGRQVVPTYHPSAALRFGPEGAPLAALRGDLGYAVTLLGPSDPLAAG